MYLSVPGFKWLICRTCAQLEKSVACWILPRMALYRLRIVGGNGEAATPTSPASNLKMTHDKGLKPRRRHLSERNTPIRTWRIPSYRLRSTKQYSVLRYLALLESPVSRWDPTSKSLLRTRTSFCQAATTHVPAWLARLWATTTTACCEQRMLTTEQAKRGVRLTLSPALPREPQSPICSAHFSGALAAREFLG
jgi:hypothetical protein